MSVVRDEPLPIEELARIHADLEAGRASRADVLAKHGLDEARWEREDAGWTRALAEDAMAGADPSLTDAYADALARARAALPPLPASSPEDWAALTLDIAKKGAPAALAARSLLPADYFRLAKQWAATLASDRQAAARYNQALYDAARP